MEKPKVLLNYRRPPLHSNKLIESLIAGKKPICPHPTNSHSSSIRSLKTSGSKESRSNSETRKLVLNKTIPIISASSWCAVEGNTGRIIYGYRDLEVKEIASLTKIMTCFVCLKIIEQKHCNLEDKVKVSKKAAGMIGTSADLKQGDLISVLDLLYGLMLPSGNDAAWSLAEHFGVALNPSTTKPVRQFISEMNKYSRTLCLYATYFANPHGLIYKKNVSSARDVCKLSTIAMKEPMFKRIVCTRSYSAEITNANSFTYKICWENTNKLLNKGFEGIKTGITDNAGPCLTAGFKGKVHVIVTLLNSKSMEARWEEAQAIVAWITSSF
jgi:serine-type D-Ala-D-Ala carboxypeptidase (penicillin-binding protein 5/6)